VGCQLSGGVDSSLVAVLASAHHPPELNTFSIVFDEPRFSEEPWILEAAATARAASHRFMFDEAAFMGALDAASWHMDQPISHPNSLALWVLARRSRDLATVLLTGEGADELFGGYMRVYDAHAASADSAGRASRTRWTRSSARRSFIPSPSLEAPTGGHSGAGDREAPGPLS
jgi:asparagine synthetase B (glutamine-hydrolysing)